jgi:competence protein ComEC
VFHKSRFSIIGIKNSRNLTLHHNLKNNYEGEKMVINYKIGHSIKNIEQDTIRSLYKINEELILVVDSIGVYKTSFKPDYVLLRNSPKINLNRLIDHLQPRMIIADGSNYKSYQERWFETCVKKEIPFHQTSKKGAYIID